MPYIPNVNQQIFSCKVIIHQDTLATFRLCTSCPSSKLLLQCTKNNKLQSKIYGVGNIILPIVLLECDNIEDVRKNSSILKQKRSSSKTDGRKFRDVKSDKLSVSSRTDNKIIEHSSLKDSGKLLKKETAYTIKGFVLDNSWPLSKEEWEVVRNLKKKRLLGTPAMSLQKIKSEIYQHF